MIICDQYGTCCNWKYCNKREDLDEEGRQCSHILEVEEVVHAKWIASTRQKFTNSDVAAIDEYGRPFIKKKLVKTVRYKCSCCNEIFDDNSLYCPECGSKMDLE